MLDDCSRVFTDPKIYQRENLLAYLDFLPEAFSQNGLPLELCVDSHSLFFTHDPKTLSQLGQALHFYGITFRFARTTLATSIPTLTEFITVFPALKAFNPALVPYKYIAILRSDVQ